MADWPTFTKNQQTATQEVTVDAPADDPSKSAEERWIDQQWRDVQRTRLGARHPLSLNRDHANIGNARDPYTN